MMLAKAIETGESMYCTMTDVQGSIVEYSAKGKKSRISGMNVSQNNKRGYIISDVNFIDLAKQMEEAFSKLR